MEARVYMENFTEFDDIDKCGISWVKESDMTSIDGAVRVRKSVMSLHSSSMDKLSSGWMMFVSFLFRKEAIKVLSSSNLTNSCCVNRCGFIKGSRGKRIGSCVLFIWKFLGE